MCLLLSLEPLLLGWFVGNSEQVKVLQRRKVTVLNRVGQAAAVQTNSARREGSCQLCSPLSSAQHGPRQSGSIRQSSLLEVELYHIQVEPQERGVALRLRQIAALFLKATGFAQFWEAALSPLLQTWYWKSLGALQAPCSSLTSSTTTERDLYPTR